MSATTVGAQMPPEITLEDVAAMAAADENHRYELSREVYPVGAVPLDSRVARERMLSAWPAAIS